MSVSTLSAWAGWLKKVSLRMAYIDRDDPAEAFSSDVKAPGSPSPSPLATTTPIPAMVPTAVPMIAPASPAPPRQATPSRRATVSRSSTPSTPSTPTHGYNTRAKRNADAMLIVNKQVGPTFLRARGFFQRSILSPWLFNVYIDDLAH
ncbi:unnamed protein product [Umbelopsis vinacea]